VRILGERRNDDVETLARAQVVIGVGTGVLPDEYEALSPLAAVLGAELAATRKVTDKGWAPRARQVGITGRSIAPRLYVALGLSGKFNHMVGVRAAGTILAVNADHSAPVFEHCDVGIVGDWHEVVPKLSQALSARQQPQHGAPVS
jgi:electron transfer flavoprotein alpha subunit